LADRVARYVFISSISAYRSFDAAKIAEDAPLAPPPVPMPESMTPETYGALKAMCEGVVRDRYAERSLVVRPGLIVGPHDRSDRFTYWPVRVARGGRVLAPGRPDRLTQFIDVRDLAEWIVRLLEDGASGVVNATGPRTPVTMEDVLNECRAASASDARFEWVPDDFLVAQGVDPWIALPLWIPESDSSSRGLMACSIDRALAMGLTFRPLARTILDTLAWARTRAPDHEWKAGLSAEREATLLAKWRASNRSADGTMQA
jgi:2'-hydroxyisoflavone reductase